MQAEFSRCHVCKSTLELIHLSKYEIWCVSW